MAPEQGRVAVGLTATAAPMSPPGVSAGTGNRQAASSVEGKSREDYLVRVEDRLLAAFEKLARSVNRHIARAYALELLTVMFLSSYIVEVSELGAKLTMSKDDVIRYVPFPLAAIYLLLCHDMVKISLIFAALKTNADEFRSANPAARAATVEDLRYLVGGLTGLMLAVGWYLAGWILVETPLRLLSRITSGTIGARLWGVWLLAREVVQWGQRVILGTVVVIAMFLLPAIVAGHATYSRFFASGPGLYGEPVALAGAGILLAASVATLVCSIRLVLGYAIDHLETFVKDWKESEERLQWVIGTMHSLRKALSGLAAP